MLMFSHFGYSRAKVLVELARAEVGGNLLQQRGGLGQVFEQRIGQRPRAPQKHAAVPEIVSRLHEFGGARCVGLFREAAHAQSVALNDDPASM